MKNYKRNILFTVIGSAAMIIACSALSGQLGNVISANGAIETMHTGNHYIRQEATGTTSGVKEYVVCCDCHEHWTAEANEFFMSPGYSTSTLVQYKILNKSVFGKSNFLASGNEGYGITYGAGSIQAGWFGCVTGEDGYGYITANLNQAASNGDKLIIAAGSYITSTDDNVYYVARDVTARYTETGWEYDETFVPTEKAGEAEIGDDRYIPATPTSVSLSLGWSSGSNVQFTFAGGETITDAEDGTRLTVLDSSYIETNIPGFTSGWRIWDTTIFGFDPTTIGATLPTSAYVLLKQGLTLVAPSGQAFQLASDYCLTCASGTWSTYDVANNGVVTGAKLSDVGFNRTIAYVGLTGTNLASYTTNPGGIVPSQAQYTGSIKFCGVEFNNLTTFSETLHLFATINGAGWGDNTIQIKIYNNDTWIDDDYSHITDFSSYDFGSAPTIEIKAGTVVTLTEGDGGTYLFTTDLTFTHNGTVWTNA